MNEKEKKLTFTQEAEDILRLNDWIFETIQQYIKERVMEIGSGTGSMTRHFSERGIPVHLSETIKANRDILRENFSNNPLIRSLKNVDYLRDDFGQAYSSMVGQFGTVTAINIAEHGFYDKKLLENATKLLRPKGHFITVSPGYAVSFNDLEEDLEDFRKYNISGVKKMLSNDFELLKFRFFNWIPGPVTLPATQFGLVALSVFQKA